MATGTAVLSADNSSVLSGQKVTFLLVITNTGTGATVQSIMPVGPLNGWWNMQPPSIPIGGLFIPASGTYQCQMFGSFGCNQNQDLNPPVPAYQQYNVSCAVNFSDGTSINSGSVTISASPITTPPTAMPGPGQLRFESNLESGLLSLVLM